MAKQTSKRQAQPEMIRCENCGELYSATYRCCPFCDERPGRRVDDYNHRNPLQLAVLIGTMIVILAAAFIVFSKVAPLLSSKAPENPEVVQPTNPDKPLTGSDLVPGSTDTETPTEPVVEQPTEPVENNAVPAVAIVLSREDITLLPNESYTLTATVAPANTTNTLHWESSHPDVLSVDETGTVTNKNATGEKVAVTITATAGKVRAECIVRCNSSGSPKPTEPSQPSTGTDTPSTPSTPTITKKTDAKVVGAGSGLNVRSGPGSNYEKVASIKNGNSVVILEDTGTGWYKIDYGNGKTGYASSQFIQPK